MNGKTHLAAAMLATLGLPPDLARADAIILDAPIAGASLHQGGVDMAVYYVDRGDHFEVVATYAETDAPYLPGRIRMALADGDRARFGLPGVRTPVLYTFERSGDAVRVDARRVGQEIAQVAQ